MPIVDSSSYQPPCWLPGGHLQTIFPALFRRVPQVTVHHERLELADGDFIDLQWAISGNSKLAILSHGLEANASTEYIQGMAGALRRNGWDILAWTFRGCGLEPNRLLRMYHSGSTEDLAQVVNHALETHPAKLVDLIGFSLGGNLTLKYLGENPQNIPASIHRAVTFSVPCDLACSSHQLSLPGNRLYMERFIRAMRAKVRAKDRLFPGQLDLSGLQKIKYFQEFDDRFTAPIHGFASAQDYWEKNSCRQFLSAIDRPTLLINALNDPFLGPGCYPFEEARTSQFFHFESPVQGGHVGFPGCKTSSENWAESRAIEFLS